MSRLSARHGENTLLDPGSLGQSRSGRALASYVLWQDGEFALKSYVYDLEATAEKYGGWISFMQSKRSWASSC